MNETKSETTERLRVVFTWLCDRERELAAEAEQAAALILRSDDRATLETHLAAWALAEAQLATARRARALFPEGITPLPPPLSESDQHLLDILTHNVGAAGSRIQYIEKHELPGMRAKLDEAPTPNELAAWRGDPDPLVPPLLRVGRHYFPRGRSNIASSSGTL